MIHPETLKTEFQFTLPKGLIDLQGNIHRQGTMRLSTAKDEICVQGDRQVQANPAYTSLVMLARVITQLGGISTLTPEHLENLFTQDIAYLREFYNRINQQGSLLISTQCPQCKSDFKVEMALSGE